MKNGYLGLVPLGVLYRCYWTGIVCLEKYMIFVPSVHPQVAGAFPLHNSTKGSTARKNDLLAFNENDANCNTCKNFIRAGSDKVKGKRSSGFVFGSCSSKNKRLDKIPYKQEGFEVMVAVGDWLGMPCWESRE